jgi:hypothetical protein
MGDFMENNDEMEIVFSKFNLKENDVLVINVDTKGLDLDSAKNRVFNTREDPLVKFIESKGNKVLVTYSGVSLNILRLEENDKVAVYADVSVMDEQETEQYIDYLKFKLKDSIGEDKLVIVPVKGNSPKLKIVKSEENNE